MTDVPPLAHPTGILKCPYCGQLGNEAVMVQAAREAAPVDGDWSICWSCRGVAVYVVGPLGLALRVLTEAEWVELRDNPVYDPLFGRAR